MSSYLLSIYFLMPFLSGLLITVLLVIYSNISPQVMLIPVFGGLGIAFLLRLAVSEEQTNEIGET